ncbi:MULTISPECIES: hypothetical protein [Rhizobium/Agrobacterium group]|uniref:Uncharacterized protein n=1 Tax=Agrobacterium vitis TaxID=373 RepID=A0ABD6HAJ2_AGRVI|nr:MULTISPECIES: hypothetical protein [Rhizobium/Agrobacterium group]MCF1448466.1 hypothetical protein [Allorhizobium ampelinum]MCF1494089.1 hypothetical protein [Allorhizobium ampelinum]MUO30583.1 hypothetical protein [Agrobacterium vitis]MUO43560.1 hypothetical protein [Agrobacterium vitis]MUP11484.1 hypothetical protein [Agrobacterium vitis]
MNEISIGAVGAAAIAGLVSLLGLVIGKEQKVSEFRQAWIDELRKCVVSYLVNINAVCDALGLARAGRAIDDAALLTNYKLLNEASHGITLRINPSEETAKALLKSMHEFDEISRSNSNLTPEKIRELEKGFIDSSQNLLKFEWARVKKGEANFVWTKRIVYVIILLMLILLAYAWFTGKKTGREAVDPHSFHLLEMQGANCL